MDLISSRVGEFLLTSNPQPATGNTALTSKFYLKIMSHVYHEELGGHFVFSNFRDFVMKDFHLYFQLV